MNKTRTVEALLLAIGMLATWACGRPAGEGAPDLAADTASLPDTDILIGELKSANEGAISVVEIEAVLAGPGYQNQPAMLGPNQGRFYYVAENSSGKTDIWVYDYNTSEHIQLTNTPRQSEFSPKPAPAGRLSFIQENEDGTDTHVYAIKKLGETGSEVAEIAPVGYFEWLNSGATLAIYYRSAIPALYLVDVLSGETRKIFENVGRSFQASPDGKSLYATQIDSNGRHRLVRVDAVSGDTGFLITLPESAQDYRILFDDEQTPAVVFSAEGSRLLEFEFRESGEWRVAADIADLGYGEISRIAIAATRVKSDNGKVFDVNGPVVFVAEPKKN